jgi:DNA-binding response OmpR family regulator
VKGGRILVVDDEPLVRQTLAQVLADEGYLVDVATDGTTALEQVHAARPDAILLDLMMPGMNGRQFLRALRDDPAYSNLPVLIMTAVHGLNVNLASIGASAVVEKPFAVDELLNKVALAVYRAGAAEAPSAPATAMIADTARATIDRGVVVVVEHDRTRLHQLDVALSERGFTVVTMTRARVQLARLARALRPRAVLVELAADGVRDAVDDLRTELAPIAVLAYARDGADAASDDELVAFVERQR